MNEVASHTGADKRNARPKDTIKTMISNKGTKLKVIFVGMNNKIKNGMQNTQSTTKRGTDSEKEIEKWIYCYFVIPTYTRLKLNIFRLGNASTMEQ